MHLDQVLVFQFIIYFTVSINLEGMALCMTAGAYRGGVAVRGGNAPLDDHDLVNRQPMFDCYMVNNNNNTTRGSIRQIDRKIYGCIKKQRNKIDTERERE